MSRHLTPNQRALERFIKNRPALLSLFFISVLMAGVLLWPLFAPFKPDQMAAAQFQPPDSKHWLGTDVHGFDLMTRLMFGARISLMVGFVGASVALIIGVTWGAVAGYLGGRFDSWMMRVVDILYALPAIVFVIVLITVLDTHVKQWIVDQFGSSAGRYTRTAFLFVGLGAVSWLTMARIVRGQVLSLRSRQFVDASRALGAGNSRILLHHILPNVLGVIITYVTMTVPAIILYESFLSYLGLGIQPPMASWGSLIAEGASQLNPIRVYWWLLVFPATALVSTLLALNFLGDGLRDAFDPRAGV
ncbi:MAG: ABC transporter permease [Pedosphaera sp.]|nr:ABC transporter permease [Pedosphaera sp.]